MKAATSNYGDGFLCSGIEGLNAITNYEYMLFRELLYKQVGIDLRPNKQTLLESRLGSRISQLGLNTFFDYYQLIESGNDPEETQMLIDLLTTNETFFFRESTHFDYLQSQILPSYRQQPMRIWSAACSSGEETYSIAMTLANELQHKNWEIVGSDISRRVLKKAKSGHYQMVRHEGISPAYLKKYCLRGTGKHEGTLLINKELREQIRFCQINLNNPLPNVGKFDVIFLRNVLIYFNQETKAEIVNRVTHHLRPGGHLFISHTENLQGIDTCLKLIRPSVFQKHR